MSIKVRCIYLKTTPDFPFFNLEIVCDLCSIYAKHCHFDVRLWPNSHVEMIMMSNFFDIGLVLAKVLITRKSQDCS